MEGPKQTQQSQKNLWVFLNQLLILYYLTHLSPAAPTLTKTKKKSLHHKPPPRLPAPALVPIPAFALAAPAHPGQAIGGCAFFLVHFVFRIKEPKEHVVVLVWHVCYLIDVLFEFANSKNIFFHHPSAKSSETVDYPLGQFGFLRSFMFFDPLWFNKVMG